MLRLFVFLMTLDVRALRAMYVPTLACDLGYHIPSAFIAPPGRYFRHVAGSAG